jgi:hypothetical protein
MRRIRALVAVIYLLICVAARESGPRQQQPHDQHLSRKVLQLKQLSFDRAQRQTSKHECLELAGALGMTAGVANSTRAAELTRPGSVFPVRDNENRISCAYGVASEDDDEAFDDNEGGGHRQHGDAANHLSPAGESAVDGPPAAILPADTAFVQVDLNSQSSRDANTWIGDAKTRSKPQKAEAFVGSSKVGQLRPPPSLPSSPMASSSVTFTRRHGTRNAVAIVPNAKHASRPRELGGSGRVGISRRHAQRCQLEALTTCVTLGEKRG